MTTKPSQKQLVTQFIQFTGANEKLATKLLKAASWKLDQAVDSYFASNGAAPASKIEETLGKLFEKYRANDLEGLTSVNGTMQYCNDIGVGLENAEHLVLFEIIKAPTAGEMSKAEFVDAWKKIGADSIQKQAAYVASQVKLLSTDLALFKRVYRWTFISAKDKNQKALPLETGLTYWKVIFSPPGMEWCTDVTNWCDLWVEFLQKNWTKSVNKDMWNQTEAFFEKVMVDPTLSFWSEDSAWPGVIDQFVEYAQREKGLKSDTMETD
ncbi:putative defective in cullin neddylation protein 1 [Drepanopeziza brunnea f. sp. 'multigermtubi' MB_m1]|uniref:Defective in cullin neddylation protein n=1 Tax=Marssonina brunnea f. sp. multigermtubi (strain MB_m1) TaxID=1072389 RepID=K1X3N5_MARBU|nr:putative defective in cullin neddylation protein 1 [Drepanopeziza brunnea f. sp. 'multigermtubi' MB_m1]EKD19851.1 putative defective in cullin neddylation protein 1 [Drepanopeziza brunnea f. sp. 'multigermtubi' MB_m1]